jgi:hypothetical protein
MPFSMTDLGKVLKRRYFSGGIPDATLKKFPFFALVPKDNSFAGQYLQVPIKYAKQPRSRDFTQAQANTGNPKWDSWLIDVVPDYVDAQVPREAVLRCKGDKSAFVSMFADVIDDGISVIDENTAGNLFRDSGGARGQLSTGAVAATFVTLADVTQEVMFEPGMVVRVSANADGTAIEVGSVTLGQVDRELGRIYTSNGNNWNHATNIPTIAASMYVYVDGDQTKGISGLPSWLLAAAPTAGVTFFNVDRYVDTRLYGTYYDGSTLPIEEAIKRGCAKAARRGGTIDYVFVSPDDYQDLEISLLNGNMLRRQTAKTEDGAYGFEGIQIATGSGFATVLSDPKCPKDTAWALEMNTWKLTYMGPKVGTTIIDEDGQMIRTYNADSFDIRCGNWCQLFCTKPGNNARIKLR